MISRDVILSASGTVLIAVVAALISGGTVRASESLRGRLLISVHGSPSVPVGRFAEVIPDADANKDKSGVKSGHSLGGSLAYSLSSKWIVGATITHSQFRLDISDSSSVQPEDIADDHLESSGGKLWVRYIPFLLGDRVSPYFHAGAQVGNLESFISIKGDELFEIAQNVGLHPGIEIGGGGLATLANRAYVDISVLYQILYSKGRQAEYNVNDNRIPEEDQDIRSNSQWWEVRFGLGVAI